MLHDAKKCILREKNINKIHEGDVTFYYYQKVKYERYSDLSPQSNSHIISADNLNERQFKLVGVPTIKKDDAALFTSYYSYVFEDIQTSKLYSLKTYEDINIALGDSAYLGLRDDDVRAYTTENTDIVSTLDPQEDKSFKTLLMKTILVFSLLIPGLPLLFNISLAFGSMLDILKQQDPKFNVFLNRIPYALFVAVQVYIFFTFGFSVFWKASIVFGLLTSILLLYSEKKMYLRFTSSLHHMIKEIDKIRT